jgi:phosphoglycerate kinase
MRTLDDLEVAGKRVLVRVDYNVPLDERGQITDDTRIRATLPTIRTLLERGAAVLLMAHLGRPRGKRRPELSLRPAADRLAELLGQPVSLLDDCVGPAVEAAARALRPGQVALLENLRFHPEEEANDPAFARQLAALADCYVNDAFGTAHRAHASTEGVAHLLPSAAGHLMRTEVEALGRVLSQPEHPVVTILGGAKISDKIGVIQNLLVRADAILIGGGMANTFLKAQGVAIGRSLVEDDKVPEARRLLDEATRRQVTLAVPTDVVVTQALEATATHRTVPVTAVGAEEIIADIGPETARRFAEVIAGARTVVWNGPMGVFEVEPFAAGTRAVAQAVAASNAFSLVGGGDSVAALEQAGLADRIGHVSTGGGASLEFLEGQTLPGVAVLE